MHPKCIDEPECLCVVEVMMEALVWCGVVLCKRQGVRMIGLFHGWRPSDELSAPVLIDACLKIFFFLPVHFLLIVEYVRNITNELNPESAR